MRIHIFMSLVILCAILSQQIVASSNRNNDSSSDLHIRQKRSSSGRPPLSPRQNNSPTQQRRQLRHREVEIIHVSRVIGIGFVRGDSSVETPLNIQLSHGPIYIAFRNPLTGGRIICGVLGVSYGRSSVRNNSVNVTVLSIEDSCPLRAIFHRN